MKIINGNLMSKEVIRKLLKLVPKDKLKKIDTIKLITRKKQEERGGWTAGVEGKTLLINLYLVFRRTKLSYYSSSFIENMMEHFATNLYWGFFNTRAKDYDITMEERNQAEDLVKKADRLGLTKPPLSKIPFFFVMKNREVKIWLARLSKEKKGSPAYFLIGMGLFDMMRKTKLRKRYRLFNLREFYKEVTDQCVFGESQDYKMFNKIIKKFIKDPIVYTTKKGRKLRYFRYKHIDKFKESKEWKRYIVAKAI